MSFNEIRTVEGKTEKTVYSIPDCLMSIIDAKVNGAGLNCLENFVDWLLTMLWDAYGTMSQIAQAAKDTNAPLKDRVINVHRFHNGKVLCDFTQDQRGGIRREGDMDYITIKDKIAKVEDRPKNEIDRIKDLFAKIESRPNLVFLAPPWKAQIDLSCKNVSYVAITDSAPEPDLDDERRTAARFRIIAQEFNARERLSWTVVTERVGFDPLSRIGYHHTKRDSDATRSAVMAAERDFCQDAAREFIDPSTAKITEIPIRPISIDSIPGAAFLFDVTRDKVAQVADKALVLNGKHIADKGKGDRLMRLESLHRYVIVRDHAQGYELIEQETTAYSDTNKHFLIDTSKLCRVEDKECHPTEEIV